MRIGWSERARRDLRGIYAYIATDNPAAARRWVALLQARARGTTSAPLAGRVVPEVDEPDVREVFFRTYRIVYRVMEGEVHVLTVFEESRPLLVEIISGEPGSQE